MKKTAITNKKIKKIDQLQKKKGGSVGGGGNIDFATAFSIPIGRLVVYFFVDLVIESYVSGKIFFKRGKIALEKNEKP